MTLTKKLVQQQAKKLLKASQEIKKPIIKKIKLIIKPYLKESGYIDQSNYINGFRPQGEEVKYIKIAELKSPVLIPRLMYSTNTTLNHFSDNSEFLTITCISDHGLYLDFGSFEALEDLSLEILEIILFQLNLIYN